ncbi:tRNA (adenosine(37)-N6)-threonylcarbamoyltransferase complex dimerization subunit type 1 TsaB [Caldovatus aquaticus]|uniref:tRNA (Adenosine(37)-N6)-threonylcarbamoyltransferase complex dimerization subunit type 1 TsaB n=1 Tax=Caldovatus aquaticus TaxID=2865671 RepID=A0ABS7EYF1_9PROT|nr:tRNA (adenosine(37)-N6)-threonylcarbamoyltransferase complex dimerization subunit type 1 TsaB [Caldovatus aquaticus]MBW8268374.1 tRNA (adenosine(37)-N6)-threonylcarbamoyltransferase complex dimerization subunit type 1 TsaB [Caldovatus aquaticus]
MPILALDGSLARCSAAVLDRSGRVLAAAAEAAERGHATLLPVFAARVLEEAGLTAPRLAAVAVGIGPGGFTGLRAALALAQGIAFGAGGLPVIGVTTGEALVAALSEEERRGRAVWAALDTRRGRIMLEHFAPGAALPEGPPAPFAEQDLPHPPGPVAVAGDAAPAVAARLLARGADALLTGARLPDAVAVGRVALLRLAGLLPPRAAEEPLYGEPPAVRTPQPSPPAPAA